MLSDVTSVNSTNGNGNEQCQLTNGQWAMNNTSYRINYN